MKMRISERGDALHIEPTGVAGQQQRVLEALTECQRAGCAGHAHADAPGQAGAIGLAGTRVSIRAGADSMRIRLRSAGLPRFEATAIYQCLRHALVERRAVAAAPIAAISPAGIAAA